MYIDKKFKLVNFYNNGMNELFCRTEKKFNYKVKSDLPPDRKFNIKLLSSNTDVNVML